MDHTPWLGVPEHMLTPGTAVLVVLGGGGVPRDRPALICRATVEGPADELGMWWLNVHYGLPATLPQMYRTTSIVGVLIGTATIEVTSDAGDELTAIDLVARRVVAGLVRGWRALKAVDTHNLDGCPSCRRYVAALLRGANAREVDHLRCSDMQAAQRDIAAADQITATFSPSPPHGEGSAD